ncbi:MAG TPA: hypothetical protein PKD18_20420 [Saprospiraceae bacterium]|nr:hypothetical protein [Saprospiraceae bacterium]HOY12520.1 hypothetical protein [Saprospiraceae bacterium]HPN68331.1 hypothetical protein [Saprospiraceae bacterium]
MATITNKINERKKSDKALLAVLEGFLVGVESNEIIEENVKTSESGDESPYNPEFVEMVLNAANSKNRTTVTSETLWQSI